MSRQGSGGSCLSDGGAATGGGGDKATTHEDQQTGVERILLLALGTTCYWKPEVASIVILDEALHVQLATVIGLGSDADRAIAQGVKEAIEGSGRAAKQSREQAREKSREQAREQARSQATLSTVSSSGPADGTFNLSEFLGPSFDGGVAHGHLGSADSEADESNSPVKSRVDSYIGGTSAGGVAL